MIKLINQSDIIFLTGGLPDQVVHRVVEKNKTVYAISNQGGLLVDETGLHLLGDVKPFKGES